MKVPFGIAFFEGQTVTFESYLPEILVDFIFVLDIFLRMFVFAFRDKDDLIMIRKRYRRISGEVPTNQPIIILPFIWALQFYSCFFFIFKI